MSKRKGKQKKNAFLYLVPAPLPDYLKKNESDSVEGALLMGSFPKKQSIHNSSYICREFSETT